MRVSAGWTTYGTFSEENIMKTSRVLFIGLLIGLAAGLTISSIAVHSQDKGAARRNINLPTRNVNAPFSDGVMVGNTLYLAGRLGIDPKTGKVPEDPAE